MNDTGSLKIVQTNRVRLPLVTIQTFVRSDITRYLVITYRQDYKTELQTCIIFTKIKTATLLKGKENTYRRQKI